jgi:hypothetical protein
MGYTHYWRCNPENKFLKIPFQHQIQMKNNNVCNNNFGNH